MKKVKALIKLQIYPTKATPAPPIGPALGQKGLNIMDLCKKFNEKTKFFDLSLKVSVDITAYTDKSFIFVVKQPSVSSLLKKITNIKKGSKMPGKNEPVGIISKIEIRKISKIKFSEIGGYDIKFVDKVVAGTAKSLGITVE